MYPSNRIFDAFDAVKADADLKSLTKEYLKAARRDECSFDKKKSRPVYRWAFGAVCAMLVLVLGIGGYRFLGMPVSYVSIDVNPSIELVLNRLDRVISAEAYNEDGETILNAVSVRGLHYTEAIDRMVESDVMRPFLGRNGGLTFTVASDSGQRENTLLNGIENTRGCRVHGGVGVGADINMLQEAHENGLSLGKYAAYQILFQYDSTITAEDCHNMTMWEIHRLIEAHGHGEEQESGNGHYEEQRGGQPSWKTRQENDSGSGQGGHGGGHRRSGRRRFGHDYK